VKNSQNAAWIVGAVFVSVIIAIAVYFLAISPQLDATAEARDQTASAKDFNDQLDLKILTMKKKEKDVPLWRGEMAAIAVDLPPTVGESDLNRFLTATLKANKVPVVSIEYGAPTVVEPGSSTSSTPPSNIAPSPEPTPNPEPSSSAEPTTDPSPAPSEPPASSDTDSTAAFQGLLAIPVTITTEGSPAGILNTIHEIATTQSRFLTITNLTIEKADNTEATPGRDELTEEDWTSTVTFMAFVLYQDGVTLAPEPDGTNPPFSPGGGNPFKPLPGTEQAS